MSATSQPGTKPRARAGSVKGATGSSAGSARSANSSRSTTSTKATRSSSAQVSPPSTKKPSSPSSQPAVEKPSSQFALDLTNKAQVRKWAFYMEDAIDDMAAAGDEGTLPASAKVISKAEARRQLFAAWEATHQLLGALLRGLR